jgi:hypothetical protein
VKIDVTYLRDKNSNEYFVVLEDGVGGITVAIEDLRKVLKHFDDEVSRMWSDE